MYDSMQEIRERGLTAGSNISRAEMEDIRSDFAAFGIEPFPVFAVFLLFLPVQSCALSLYKDVFRQCLFSHAGISLRQKPSRPDPPDLHAT